MFHHTTKRYIILGVGNKTSNFGIRMMDKYHNWLDFLFMIFIISKKIYTSIGLTEDVVRYICHVRFKNSMQSFTKVDKRGIQTLLVVYIFTTIKEIISSMTCLCPIIHAFKRPCLITHSSACVLVVFPMCML